MRYPLNYLCFPCRRSARVGLARQTGRRNYHMHHPLCPSCSQRMLEFGDGAPKGEKGWRELEHTMKERYQEDLRWLIRYYEMVPARHSWRADDGPAHAHLAGHPCAPLFFRSMIRS